MTNKGELAALSDPDPHIPLGDLAQRLGCILKGNPEILVNGISTLETAGPTELSFLTNRRYLKQVATTRAACIITSPDFSSLIEKTLLISDNPYLTFAQALEIFAPPEKQSSGIHPQAVISATARIGSNVSIGAFTEIGDKAVIGNNVSIHSHCAIYPDSVIGDDSLIYSHCVIRAGCRIGAKVILQNGVIIGSDGFGYARRNDGSWHKIPQTGTVIIEDEVEIGSGSVIDRATIGVTRICKGARIDNLVQVGHGSIVGEHSLICAQTGLAGSTIIGRHVTLGGQTGVAGHLTIGDRVTATAQTGIPNSVPSDSVISGYPAINNRDWLKASAVFARLPNLYKEILFLKHRLAELTRKSDSTSDSKE